MFDFIGKLVFFTAIFLAGDLIGVAGLKTLIMTISGAG
tara:strand:+ start:871 stop:984 length:114 start_codon:yes stop_codon:yes gene_type:complete